MKNEAAEILNITIEECAEVTQAISKIFRFGFSGADPISSSGNNLMHLEEEIGDLLCMFDILVEKRIIDPGAVKRAKLEKREKLRIWSKIDLNGVL